MYSAIDSARSEFIIVYHGAAGYPSGMSRKAPGPEALEALREHFRKLGPPSTPKDYKAAAVLAGVTQAVAMRAWERGWPGVIEPIEVQLARERAVAKQSADLLRVENIVNGVKTSAVLLLSELRRLHPVVHALVDNLANSHDEIEAMDAEDAVKVMQRLSKVHKDIAAVGAKAVELDRLLENQPTRIVGVRAVEPDAPVDLERARATNEALARAIARAEASALTAASAPAAKQELRRAP
jgi:hypothetical protein